MRIRVCRLVTLYTESEIIHDLIHQRAAQRNFCMRQRTFISGILVDIWFEKSLKDGATHNNSLERSLWEASETNIARKSQKKHDIFLNSKVITWQLTPPTKLESPWMVLLQDTFVLHMTTCKTARLQVWQSTWVTYLGWQKMAATIVRNGRDIHCKLTAAAGQNINGIFS